MSKLNKVQKTIITIVVSMVVVSIIAKLLIVHLFIEGGRKYANPDVGTATTEAVVTTEDNDTDTDVAKNKLPETGLVKDIVNKDKDDVNNTEVEADTENIRNDINNNTRNNTDTVTAPAVSTSANAVPAVTNTYATEAPSAPATEAPVINTCQHNWVTITDSEAWDEPIYEEQPIYEQICCWDDGTPCPENWGSSARHNWCFYHCTTCYPDCPDPDPRGWCALYNSCNYQYNIVGYETVQVGTKHHDAVTHVECSKCGMHK